MRNQARELTAAFQRAARPGILEKPFRDAVEAYLVALAQRRGIELVPHTEVTLGSSGRADTIYNRFIIEWEKPGSLKPSNNAPKNRETIAQVQRYGDNLFWVTREHKPHRQQHQRPGRLRPFAGNTPVLGQSHERPPQSGKTSPNPRHCIDLARGFSGEIS